MADTPELTDVEKLRIEIRAQERADAEGYFKEAFEVWKADELVKLEERMSLQVKQDVEKLVEKWIEDQKPPTQDQLKALLNQEYAEFPVKVWAPSQQDDSDKLVEYEFTIRELPQSAEKKFFKQFKDRVLGNANQINAWIQRSIDKPVEEKVAGFLETVENGFDLLAEATVLVLNPRGKKAFVTQEWVQDNISSIRQWNIVQAQADANKLRDFFSQLSRSGRGIQTMTENLNVRNLHQLAQS